MEMGRTAELKQGGCIGSLKQRWAAFWFLCAFFDWVLRLRVVLRSAQLDCIHGIMRGVRRICIA